jgi:hypothetical protein
LIDLPASSHAVLSQFFPEHLQNLFQAYLPILNQADYHPYMLHHLPIPPALARLPCRDIRLLLPSGSRRTISATVVQVSLLLLTLRITVVRDAPFGGLLLAVGLPAAKGATQDRPLGIARRCEKVNAAMPAALQALS